MTKTAAKTTKTAATAKENATMPKTTAAKTRRLTRDEWKVKYVNDLKAKAEELGNKFGDTELPVPCNLYHKLNEERIGSDPKALYASDVEMTVLALTCLENGWPTAEFISKNQAEEYGGAPIDGATAIKLHGKNIGRGFNFYNAAQIEWADGEPVWHQEVYEAHQAKYASRKKNEKSDESAPAPTQLIHIKLPNGVELDVHNAKEAKEMMDLFA